MQIENWLNHYGIQLKRKSAKGLWIEGSEESRRFAIIRLLREELGEKSWYQIAKAFLTSNKFCSDTTSSRFTLFINQLELPFCRKIIQYIEENISMSMSVISEARVMVYLGVCHSGHEYRQHPEW